MIEFDVDMSYLLECDELDKVVLNDENGEHEPMEFVPKNATVGDKPKDNPRNYNPDGTPKIPNMHIGADPDWVDWVARLKHEEPLSLKEAVEQLMFETICFGGDMGPNDCGGEHCPDEGMVYTNDFINGWVNKIAATVGRRDTMELWPEWEQVLFANVTDEVAQDNLNECVHELLEKAATVALL